MTLESWQQRAASVAFDGRAVINGERVEIDATETIDIVSPRDGRRLQALGRGSAADAARAVAAARSSFDAGHWRSLSPLIRKSILFGYAAAIEKEAESLALLDCLEMGKPINQALGDVVGCAHIIRYFAEWADKIHGDSAPPMTGAIHFNRREPRGVVAGIVPWNYPLPNAALKIGPALAAGNSIVLKPSEWSPSSALRLAEIAIAAGIPPGVLNVLPGAGVTVGSALAAHEGVDLIAFTGSTGTGRTLARLAADRMTALQLECGGKSANIVFDDLPDLDVVADDVAQRIFTNQGQLCVAGTRLIVHENRKAQLVDAVRRRAEALAIGDPLDPATAFGPLASSARAESISRAIHAALDAGATALCGGPRSSRGGAYLDPTILDDVRVDMAVAQQDLFGPVLSVMSFTTIDEAIALANSTPFGLTATVWTRDLKAAGAMVDRLAAGRITVLAAPPSPIAATVPLASEPFGQSGKGAEAGREGFEIHTRLKAIELHY